MGQGNKISKKGPALPDIKTDVIRCQESKHGGMWKNKSAAKIHSTQLGPCVKITRYMMKDAYCRHSTTIYWMNEWMRYHESLRNGKLIWKLFMCWASLYILSLINFTTTLWNTNYPLSLCGWGNRSQEKLRK